MSVKLTLQQAIARQEGFYMRESLAARNHNPGNIIWSRWAEAHGASEGEAGFAAWPSDTEGMEALSMLLRLNYANMPVKAAIEKYCPRSQNGTNTDIYIVDVCTWCQCTPETNTSELISIT